MWADWFLFSDAYLNGLRATFLRSSNSGVTPYHSICGDAPEIVNKTSSEENNEGAKITQDGALAMGKAAAMKELLGLPLAELERRCRHNGLSLCGGREMMVARLLYLEEAERERGYERNDDLKYGQAQVSKTLRDESSFNPHLESVNLASVSQYGKEVIRAHPEGSASPEAKDIMNKREKIDPVLPASKWSREDDVSDDEDKKSGLGISYSSESEAAGDLGKAVEAEVAADNVMNEEQRSYNIVYETNLYNIVYETNFSSFKYSSREFVIIQELINIILLYRQKLRRLEIAVMEYRESLEERGVRNTEDIEKKVAGYRKRLQSEFGLSDSVDDGSKSGMWQNEKKIKLLSLC